MTRPRTIVVHPDAQVPYQSQKVVNTFLQFLRDFDFDELASVGDEVDFPQVSRWSRGMEGEYRGDLQSHVDQGVAYLSALRDAIGDDRAFHISRSNHMDRPLRYVRQYAPGLLGLKALTVESLLEFDRLGITYHEKPFEVASRWLLMHGDEGGLSQKPGETALKLANRSGYSVVCGHTHRAGLVNNVQAVKGKPTNTVWGLEVGNLMDARKASYLGGGISNWQQAFGILYVDSRGRVTPNLVPITNGTFVVEGVSYG